MAFTSLPFVMQWIDRTEQVLAPKIVVHSIETQDQNFASNSLLARATLRAPELALRSWVLRDWEI